MLAVGVELLASLGERARARVAKEIRDILFNNRLNQTFLDTLLVVQQIIDFDS